MLIINLLGIALIALIIWWFWLYQPEKKKFFGDEILIEVKDGVYSPAAIQVKANSLITLKFTRVDQSPCSKIVQLPKLGISKELTADKVTEIKLKDLEPGTYEFHCQMQMYRGMITVV